MISPPLFFAGTFNPIHHGHLLVSQAAAEAAGADRVILVPSAQNPLKTGDTASGEDRLTMCRLAVAGMRMFEVSDIELRRAAPSYTIDTVEALALQGYGKIRWLMGADQIPMLPKWREIGRLLTMTRFIIAGRPGFELDWGALPGEFAGLRDQVVNTPLIQISATEIRRRVAASLAIDFMTPPAVARYIRERGLYRG